MLLFATEKQVKRVFRAFIPKSVKEFRKRENLHTLFSCTFGAKSTKSLRTSFSAGACEPRHCTGRARSGLCATPWRTRRSPPSLFPRQTRVRIGGAANGGIVYFTWQCASEARSSLLFLPASGCVSLLFRKTNHPRNSIFLFPQGDSRLGSDGERAVGGLKARAAGTVCLQTRELSPDAAFSLSDAGIGIGRVAFAAFRHRKAEKKEKVFSCTFGAKSTKSLRTSFSAGLREPRRCTGRARSSLCATPWRTRRSPHPLFPRQTRVRNYCAANGGIDCLYMAMRSGILFTRKAIPDLVPMAGKRTEG